METRTIRRLAWSLIGVLLGLGLLLALPDEPPSSPTTAAQAPASRATASAAGPAANLAPHGAVAARSAPTARAPTHPLNAGTRAVMLDQDLHALAVALLAAAERGDAEAQFSLHEVLADCRTELGRFPDRAALEAQLATLPRRVGVDTGRLADLYRSRFTACDGFRSDDLTRFGDPLDWLKKSAEAGNILARLAALHEPALLEGRTEDEVRDEAIAAVRDGLASGRPEALYEAVPYEFPDSPSGDPRADRDALPNAVAWWLVACARGLECGPQTRSWRERVAYGGMPQYESWEDMVLYDIEPHEREPARQRARELLRALDAGDYDAILPATLREPDE